MEGKARAVLSCFFFFCACRKWAVHNHISFVWKRKVCTRYPTPQMSRSCHDHPWWREVGTTRTSSFCSILAPALVARETYLLPQVPLSGFHNLPCISNITNPFFVKIMGSCPKRVEHFIIYLVHVLHSHRGHGRLYRLGRFFSSILGHRVSPTIYTSDSDWAKHVIYENEASYSECFA